MIVKLIKGVDYNVGGITFKKDQPVNIKDSSKLLEYLKGNPSFEIKPSTPTGGGK